jgi:hypothetical protein
MATRKQRRRREKSFRHEYGFVVEDEEGNEVELDRSELRAAKATPEKAKVKGKPDSKAKPRRAARDPDPPSWRRSARRGMIWSPATVLLSIIVFRSASVPARVAIGLVYAAAFIPMTYWIDGFVYRRHERRKLGSPPRSGRGR